MSLLSAMQYIKAPVHIYNEILFQVNPKTLQIRKL